MAPVYPPLAKALRIEGNVELQLSVEPVTGDVLDVLPLSGDPLPRPSAMEAAGQRRFEPKPIDSRTLNLTLDFALRLQVKSACYAQSGRRKPIIGEAGQ